jgi:hypothetical protein
MLVSCNCRYLILIQHGYSRATMLYPNQFAIRFRSTQRDAVEDGSWYVTVSFCIDLNLCSINCINSCLEFEETERYSL